jgi:hypothetical protein
MVSAVLGAIKDADVTKVLDALSDNERSILMKYVYRGMATGQNCTALLKWHGAIVDKVRFYYALLYLLSKYTLALPSSAKMNTKYFDFFITNVFFLSFAVFRSLRIIYAYITGWIRSNHALYYRSPIVNILS